MHSANWSLEWRTERFLPRVLAPFLAVALAAALATAPACAPELDPKPSSAAVDPALLGWGTGGRLLDDGHRQVLLGPGWHDPPPARRSIWAGGSAKIYFASEPRDDLELRVRLSPFEFDGAPQQSWKLRLDGRLIDHRPLKAGWQTLTVPLPLDGSAHAIHEVDLAFAYARRPVDLGLSGDRRSLSARFRRLSVMPRDAARTPRLPTPEAASDLRRIQLDAARPHLDLPAPATPSFALQLATVASDGPAVLAIELLERGLPPRELWRGEASRADGLQLDVLRQAVDPGRVRIRLVADGERAEVQIQMTLPHDVVSLPERPRWPRPPNRPPVFVYVIDTLRADALDIYSADGVPTPRFRQFTEDAVVFADARSTAPWTLPSTASLLSGLLPPRHGLVRADLRRTPPEDERRLPERLQALGYETLGISQSWVVSSLYGLDRGFDSFYVNDLLGTRRQESENVRWFLWNHLLGASGEPLLAYLHTVAPHRPYIAENPKLRPWSRWNRLWDRLDRSKRLARLPAADPQRVEFDRTLYDAEVAYADAQFGAFIDLLKYVGLYEQSLVVVTSDHGEEFLEHGGIHHVHTLFDELIRVPLLLKLPDGRHRGRRIEEAVSGVDVLPTILDALGLPAGDTLDGRSLLPMLDGPPAATRAVVAHTAPSEAGRPGTPSHRPALDLRALVYGQLKCIHNVRQIDRFSQPVAEFRTFDLETDPEELDPLDPSDPRSSHCVEGLKLWAEIVGSAKSGSTAESITAEERSRLEALGYL